MASKALHEVRFIIGLSLRYHSKRRAFFEVCHRTTMTLVAVGGSAAFVAVLGQSPIIAAWSSLMLTILATLDAAIGYSQKAREYEALFKRFADLSIALDREKRPNADFIREIKALRRAIEKDEPPLLSVLNVMCHNEQAEAMGLGQGAMHKVEWWQRAFAHFTSLPPHTFPLDPKDE